MALAEARAWSALVALVLCRGYRAGLVTLLLAALVPVVWGWTGYAVRSGSMEPSISTGDVVVAQPLQASDRLDVGRVMLFDRVGADPVIHRVVSQEDDGTYRTAGDANADVDSTPVERERFRARAMILVPWVALPYHWLTTGELVALLVWSTLTVVAFVLPFRLGRSGGSGGSGGARGRRVRRAFRPGRRRTPARLRRVAAPLAFALVAGATVSLSTMSTAQAGFSAKTSTRPNTWTVATRPLQRYTAAVLADYPYVFYRLEEAGGTVIQDESPQRFHGNYASVTAFRQPGSLPNNFGYSVGLSGFGRLLTGGEAIGNPSTYSVELWFKTTSTKGGKLFGFESTRDATSPMYDRHVFMNAAGQLVYGGWSSAPRLLTSPASYNNGGWHHLVLTSALRSGIQQATMYVDGQRVASGPTTPVSNYAGWWRAGYGTLPSGSGYPTGNAFVGNIDNIAGYLHELSASRVAAHYAAR